MKKLVYLIIIVACVLNSCQKELIDSPAVVENPLKGFTKYTIAKGQQYADINPLTATTYQQLRFEVLFDESAVYATKDPINQYDINKLYGFADNNAKHHEYSARLGWRFSKDSLRVFGYIYNNKIRSEQEITTIPIGQKIECSITVDGSRYIFMAAGKKLTMPRAATGDVAKGYRLYPYFGGNEVAPHDISIWIKEQ
jgi:hypothetical protein